MKQNRDEEAFEKERKLQEFLRKLDTENKIMLVYFDEAGFCTIPCVPYAWQPKGETLEINSQHSKRLNVLGFITRGNRSFFQSVEGLVNTDTVVATFDAFARQYADEYAQTGIPCIVNIDNASIHTGKKFLAKRGEWEALGVGIHFLPTYSPEFNLIEILWRKMKYEWLPLDAYNSYLELKKSVLETLENFGTKYTITFV